MGTLKNILSSRVRAEIFRLLFGLDEHELHLREMERQTGLSHATIRQDMLKLVKLDLVLSRQDGNRLYYRANTAHPLYPVIRQMVLMTAGLADILKSALDRKGVELAFVFGSLASNKGKAESDLDLMVIGDVGLRALSSWLAGVAEQVGREVNPYTLTREEFQRKKGEHFLSTVLDSPKLFVIGTEDELAAMG